MKTEEIVMIVFLSVIVVGIPTILWIIQSEKKREEEEDRKRWKK